MKRYIIRELTGEDLEEGARVIRESFRTVADDFNFTYENNPMHGAFLKKERLENEAQKGMKMYGLFVEHKQIGFVAVEELKGGEYEMQKLGVLPTYRHLGYGKVLVDFVKELVTQKGGNRITVGVIEESHIIKAWYEKLGFKTEKVVNYRHLSFTVGVMSYLIQ